MESEIYVWGDPREREEKAWMRRGKLALAALAGIVAGYLWAVLRVVE